MQVEGIQNISVQAYLPQVAPSEGGGVAPAAAEIPQGSQQTLTDAIIQFVNDQKSGRVLIQVVQPDSGKVIRQIPSEQDLAITQRLGLVLDKIA
jgi:flagellar protein FlaG